METICSTGPATEGSMILDAFLLLSLDFVPPPQSGSANFRLSEITYAQGEKSRELHAGTVKVASEVIGADLGGQAKSWSYLLSADILTEDFSLFLERPVDLGLTSTTAAGTVKTFQWQMPPDADFADGYRLQVFSSPNRQLPPLTEFEITPATVVNATLTMPQGSPLYVHIRSFRGLVESSPSYLVLVPYTNDADQGDTNGDGRTDGADLVDALMAVGSVPGDPSWNPGADLDGNLTVNWNDVDQIAARLGWRR